jgi:hypothetical protein
MCASVTAMYTVQVASNKANAADHKKARRFALLFGTADLQRWAAIVEK